MAAAQLILGNTRGLEPVMGLVRRNDRKAHAIGGKASDKPQDVVGFKAMGYDQVFVFRCGEVHILNSTTPYSARIPRRTHPALRAPLLIEGISAMWGWVPSGEGGANAPVCVGTS